MAKQLVRVARCEVHEGRDGKWRWNLHSGSKIIATSGESFANRASAKRAAENVKARAGSADVVVVEPVP